MEQQGMIDSPPESAPQSARSRLTAYLKDATLKGKAGLQHAVGLGHQPNVIPPGDAQINDELRTVWIAWHPVGGFGGKWFAEQTGVGKMITKSINKYPDPTQHWAVLVGDFAHQLWMDEHMDVIYINEKVKLEDWHTFEVGKTRFNDEALRQTGEMVIYNMRETRPAYNLISNNCQNFATLLLDAVKLGTKREFGTTFEIYQRATGAGEIKDLFIDDNLEEGQQQQDTDEQPAGSCVQGTVGLAQQVMDENTTQLDHHESRHW